MGLETGTYISDLNANNPVSATDPVTQGANHLRLIKSTILNSFPNITGALTLSHVQLNNAAIKNQDNTFTGNLDITGTMDITGAVTVTGDLSCAGFTSTGIDDNASSTAVTIDSSGNVSVGTDTAVDRLTVEASGFNGVNVSSPTANGGGTVRVKNDNGSQGFVSMWGSGTSSPDTMVVGTTGAHGFDLFTNNIRALRIDSSQRLGLGTTPDAQYKAHIRAADRFALLLESPEPQCRINFRGSTTVDECAVGTTGDTLQLIGNDVTEIYSEGQLSATFRDTGTVTASVVGSFTNTDSLSLAGGATLNSGASLELYGGAAGGFSGRVQFERNGVPILANTDGTEWDFQTQDLRTSGEYFGTVQGTGIAAGQGRFRTVSSLPGTPDANTIYFVV